MSRFLAIGRAFRIPGAVLCLLSGLALILLAAHTVPAPQPAPAASDIPERKAPAARSKTTLMVVTLCPGQSAATIESRVTNHMERWLQRAPGAYQVESRSLPGVSMVRVAFRAETDPRHALAATMSLVMAAWPDWPGRPAGTQPPLVLPFDPTVTRPVGMVALSVPGKSLILQRDMARLELCGMLGNLPGVLAPVVLGGADRIMRLDLDRPKLAARALSPLDVVTAVY